VAVINAARNLVAGLRYAAPGRIGYGSRLERYVRASYLAGLTPWYCSQCHRYTRTRVGLAAHILACREVLS
jgi:hypothetical protein